MEECIKAIDNARELERAAIERLAQERDVLQKKQDALSCLVKMLVNEFIDPLTQRISQSEKDLNSLTEITKHLKELINKQEDLKASYTTLSNDEVDKLEYAYSTVKAQRKDFLKTLEACKEVKNEVSGIRYNDVALLNLPERIERLERYVIPNVSYLERQELLNPVMGKAKKKR